MDKRDMRGWLDDHLNQLDWGEGLSKAELVLAVEDDEALRNLIGQYVVEGYYRTTVEVLNVIPEQAWQDAQGDAWHGGETYDIAGMESGFLESPVARDRPEGQHASGQMASPQGESSATGDAGQRVQAVATAAARTTIDRGPELARQAADQARSLASHPPRTATAPPPRMTAVLLSALNEGLGQAYNRQYAKAGGFFLTGIALSSASGLNTWLLRDRLGIKVSFGARRVRPLLVSLWAATYLYNLWDAWINASDGE